MQVCTFVTDGGNSDNRDVSGQTVAGTYCTSRKLQTCTLETIVDDMKTQDYKIFAIGVFGRRDKNAELKVLQLSSCFPSFQAAHNEYMAHGADETWLKDQATSCAWYKTPTDFAAFQATASALGKTLASLVPLTLAKVATKAALNKNAGVHKYVLGSGSSFVAGGAQVQHTQILTASSKGGDAHRAELEHRAQTSAFDFMVRARFLWDYPHLNSTGLIYDHRLLLRSAMSSVHSS